MSLDQDAQSVLFPAEQLQLMRFTVEPPRCQLMSTANVLSAAPMGGSLEPSLALLLVQNQKVVDTLVRL